jgi:dCTP deaminase
MILTDREIRLALRTGRIVIQPVPDDPSFSATSVDLTLGDRAREWIAAPAGSDLRIDPGSPQGFHYKGVEHALTVPVEPNPAGQFVVEPGGFLLGWTREHVDLPVEHGIAARVEGRSSLGRIGIGVHVTAPTIHAGFKGLIQLEIVNHAPNPVLLTPGMRVCQLIFELTMGTPEKAYGGQFLGQTSRDPGALSG